jgi:hypothetical protein
MDALQCILGSELRADVLAVFFLDEPRQWRLSELGRAVDRPPHNISREVDWLVQAGVITVVVFDEKRSYAIDAKSPLVRQLGQLVRQARGPIPAIRLALGRLDLPVIAWLTQGSLPTARREGSPRSDLIVLSSAPKSLIQLHLASVLGRDTRAHPMSVAEWIARLHKGEVVARRARRGQKVWVVGSWEELVTAERHHLEFRRTLDAAMANWREELSDEWDEDWDPLDAQVGMDAEVGLDVKVGTG